MCILERGRESNNCFNLCGTVETVEMSKLTLFSVL